MAPQVILGACRPRLAHQGLQIDTSIAALLPCNVIVRTLDDTTLVEAFDPDAMPSLARTDAVDEGLHAVATDARHRLTTALTGLEKN